MKNMHDLTSGRRCPEIGAYLGDEGAGDAGGAGTRAGDRLRPSPSFPLTHLPLGPQELHSHKTKGHFQLLRIAILPSDTKVCSDSNKE